MGLVDISVAESVTSGPFDPVELERRPAAPGVTTRVTDHLHDVHLMGRVAAGDQEAFAAIFDRHSPIVLGVLMRMMRDKSLAEEILQEAFLQAWRQAASYRPQKATPRGWLVMLARSRALDRLRADRARRGREDATARQGGAAALVPAEGPKRLEEEERRRTVSSILERLPEAQRRCIELAYFDGLSHTQIAESLEEPLGTIKSRLRFGMQKLREVLTAEAGA